MAHDDQIHMGPGIKDDNPVRAAVFSERVSELQDLYEMAKAIRLVAVDVKKGLLGDSVPDMGPVRSTDAQYDAGVDRKASDTNLIDEVRALTDLTRDNLQIISDVLNSLGQELGNLGGANEAGYRPGPTDGAISRRRPTTAGLFA